MFFYSAYRKLTTIGEPVWESLLQKRIKRGKELPERIHEKQGISKLDRPPGQLVWLHAASIGEAQSALILIDKLNERTPDLNILVTTGTVTSARVLEDKLPKNAIHQFYPLDHPEWVKSFLDNWSPDLVLWLESELWPNMLHEIRERRIPAALINARMSPRSYRLWHLARPLARQALDTFEIILAQTAEDAERLTSLRAKNITVTDNLKYSAKPLTFDPAQRETLQKEIGKRPLWLFASTHKGEEEMATRLHVILKKHLPGLLTIIVPRHPERRDDIKTALADYDVAVSFRGEKKHTPNPQDDLYIADTLGELGLFYCLCPLACIGRSFSDDGGGGHNPLEAAQRGCVVLHGPNIQNLRQIYDEMDGYGAALRVAHESAMTGMLLDLLKDPSRIKALQEKGLQFSKEKAGVIEKVMSTLEPLLQKTGIGTEENEDFPEPKRTCG